MCACMYMQAADPDQHYRRNVNRNRRRGGNVRNLKNLGSCDAKAGG